MTVQIELGYAYWGAGRSAEAARAFERAWHADPANLRLAQQLVYVYQRLKQNDAARRYVEQVLDASASLSEMPASDDSGGMSQDRRFGFQRLHEDLGRRVTVNLDGWSGTAVGAGSEVLEAGRHYRSYSQVEADVRLGSPPIRDGSTLSAYARVFADGGDLRSGVPSQNAMLGIGLRWKPLRNQVLYLAAENQIGLDDRQRRDVLVRVSASFLNGGRYGDDWHPARAGWFSRNLYLDAAQYLKTSLTAVTADYRTSYHRRLWNSATLEPYAHLQFNGTRKQPFRPRRPDRRRCALECLVRRQSVRRGASQGVDRARVPAGPGHVPDRPQRVVLECRHTLVERPRCLTDRESRSEERPPATRSARRAHR